MATKIVKKKKKHQESALENVKEKIVWPDIEVNGVKLDPDSLVMTADNAKKLLGWETEEEFAERIKEEDPDVNEKSLTYGDDFLLKDEEGNKVRCRFNSKNRPFDETHCRKLAQDILNRHFELNLETIVISRTGKITSGQHRLIALIIAAQKWAGDEKDHWAELWDEEPYIQSLVAFGGSDDPKVLRTVDNVKTRTLSDVFYTSDYFSDITDSVRRKECARMTDNALDLLWRRLGAGDKKGTFSQFHHYQTHSESLAFLERHPKLMEYVRFFFDKNNEEGRIFGKDDGQFNLSPGSCAALMYLMATADSDVDSYIDGDPPSEKELDFEKEEEAYKFWNSFIDKAPSFSAVRYALGSTTDPEVGGGGNSRERNAVIVRAWHAYLEDEMPRGNEDEYVPVYLPEEDYDVDSVSGERKFVGNPLVSHPGIDVGEGKSEKPLTEEEMEKRKKEERKRRREEMEEETTNGKPKKSKKVKAPIVEDDDEDIEEDEDLEDEEEIVEDDEEYIDEDGSEDTDDDDEEVVEDDEEEEEPEPEPTPKKKPKSKKAEAPVKKSEKEKWEDLKGEHPKKLLLFRNEKGGYSAFQEDAETVASTLGLSVTKLKDDERKGMTHTQFPSADLEKNAERLIRAGFKPAVVSVDKDGFVTVDDEIPGVRPAKSPKIKRKPS